MGSRPEHTDADANTPELANYIVGQILAQANDWRFWATLGSRLTILSEAAPEVVLDRIEDTLDSEPPPFLELFRQEGDTLFGGGCLHAGLLWALECLAWSPDHFSRVAFILARLADLDPGGQYGNRPRESLRSLFLGWVRHSTASDEHRLATLDEVLRRFPNAGWTLLTDVCPKGHDSVSGGHLPEWRGWGQDLQQPTRREWFDFGNAIVDRVLIHVDADAQRWGDVMNVLTDFWPERRREAVAMLDEHRERLKSSRASVDLWEKIRSLLHQHREFPEADWVLPSEELDRLARVYDYLCPDDPIIAIAWLFGHWPELPEGQAREYREHQARIEQARAAALASLIERYGDEVVIELARSSAGPWAVGWTFALVCSDEDRIASLVMPHLGDTEPGLRDFALNALGHLRGRLGWPASERMLERTREAGSAPQQLAGVYLAAPPVRDTWERLEREPDEVQAAYWSSFGATFGLDENNFEDLEYALQHLLDVRRPLPVIRKLAHTTAVVQANLIIQALELAPSELMEANSRGEKPDVHGYDIAKLFEKLDASADVTRQTVARLEVPFVSVLSHDRPHLALHHEVMEDAATFADFIGWAFKSSDTSDEQEAQDEQRSIARAQLAGDILYHLHRIPGQNEDGSVNTEHLAHWVSEARRLCGERGRGDIGDQMIGRVLANAPERP
jgi:hypothetical protein